MKYYAYYPGCTNDGTAIGQSMSIKATSKALNVELVELEDWNCCGSTPYASVNRFESLVLAARNLALADKTGFDLVTPCSSCHTILRGWSLFLKYNPKVRKQVNEALAVADLEYNGDVRVRHLTDVLINDVTLETIAAKVSRGLGGLKVAPYYGCQLVRPDHGFDDPECPMCLDRLITTLGGEAIPYPLKSHCCGGSLIIPEERLALTLIRKLLDTAVENGAQCIITPCPMCQTNLDAYQRRVNSEFKTKFNLPVLFVTQLIGLALGIKAKLLGLNTNIVPPNVVLKHVPKQEVRIGA